MKTILKNLLIVLSLILAGCDKDALLPTDAELLIMQDKANSKNTDVAMKATGEVLVTYVANPGGHNDNNQNGNDAAEGKTRFALVTFDAHEASKNKEAKGNLTIVIKDENGLTKREFKASVYDVEVTVEPGHPDAWFLARIESDIRSDEGHSGEDEHDSGAPSGNGQMNGQSNDTNHDSDMHDEEDHEGGCNSGDQDHGNKSRLGDTIEVRVHDDDSPGTIGDLIKWKWHATNASHAPSGDNRTGWEEMCNKEIIEGNLVVHVQ
jgi:hypothetical protein